MQYYTQERALVDINASLSSIAICEELQAIAEADRTEEEIGILLRNKLHLELKMDIPLFVENLTAEQKSAIETIIN